MMQTNYTKTSSFVSPVDININWINAEYYRPIYLDILANYRRQKLEIKELSNIADITRVTGFEIEKYLELVEYGHPFLRVKNVKECFIDFYDMHYIPNKVHSLYKKSQFVTSDIALTITGRVGTAAIIPVSNYEFNACQDVVRIRLKSNASIDPYYLTVYLNSRFNYLLLQRFNSGASRPRTLINNVRKICIPIPTPEIQKYIGDKIRKVEKLRQEADYCKSQAEKIFYDEYPITMFDKCYSWIVNAAELSSYRIDQSYYKPDYLIAEKQINSFKTDKKILRDLQVNISGGAPVASETISDNGIPFIRIRDIGWGHLTFNDFISFEFKEKYQYSLSNSNDIVVGMDGDDFRAGIFLDKNPNAIINQRISILKSNHFDPYYLTYFINSFWGQIQLKRKAVRTTVGHISASDIGTMVVLIPSKDKVQTIAENYQKYLFNYQEIEDLINNAKKDVEYLFEGTFKMESEYMNLIN